jgi:hypothetical protein
VREGTAGDRGQQADLIAVVQNVRAWAYSALTLTAMLPRIPAAAPRRQCRAQALQQRGH